MEQEDNQEHSDQDIVAKTVELCSHTRSCLVMQMGGEMGNQLDSRLWSDSIG